MCVWRQRPREGSSAATVAASPIIEEEHEGLIEEDDGDDDWGALPSQQHNPPLSPRLSLSPLSVSQVSTERIALLGSQHGCHHSLSAHFLYDAVTDTERISVE